MSDVGDTGTLQNEWATPDHAQGYLHRGDAYPPHRGDGEEVLLDTLPSRVERVLDLGAGDGRSLALVLAAHPGARGVALDFSPTMLEAARARFAGDDRVELVAHDLDAPLPVALGRFDVVVSSFAIHHYAHARKRVLSGEIFDRLEPGGVFCNLEHVASPTRELHLRFFAASGADPADEDPSNRLAPVEVQLGWLREEGFTNVDCLWKWRELALLTGVRPV